MNETQNKTCLWYACAYHTSGLAPIKHIFAQSEVLGAGGVGGGGGGGGGEKGGGGEVGGGGGVIGES